MTQPSESTKKVLIEMWDSYVRKLDAELMLKDAQADYEKHLVRSHTACKTEGYTGTLVRGCAVIEVHNQCIKLTGAEILE